MKWLAALLLFVPLHVNAQFMGNLYWPTQSGAQGSADAIHAWLYANDAAYKISVDSGQTTQWDVPHQTLIFNDNPPGLIPDPNDKRYYIITTMRCWGAMTAEQQAWITGGGQTFLQLGDKTNLLITSATGLRDY